MIEPGPGFDAFIEGILSGQEARKLQGEGAVGRVAEKPDGWAVLVAAALIVVGVGIGLTVTVGFGWALGVSLILVAPICGVAAAKVRITPE